MFDFATDEEEATYYERTVHFVPEHLSAGIFKHLRECGVEATDVRLFESGMVGVSDEEQDEREEELAASSHARYLHRRQRFVASGVSFPRARHAAWWLLHNCVAHLAIGLAPCAGSFWLHDATSRRLNLLT